MLYQKYDKVIKESVPLSLRTLPLSRRRQPTHCVHWSIPLSLKSLFCRLAATGANKVPRPSRYSLTMVTGSKRSSADSDLLLCHVRLRRTSRLSFWQKFGCEHSEIGFILIVPSAHILNPRPLALSRRRRPRSLRESVNSHLYIRACRQCVHESARLSRVICSLAWYG